MCTWKRDVNQLIESSRPQQRRIDLVRTVRSPDNEHVLLCVHAVHFSEDLVENSVACFAAAAGSAAGFGDGVEFVKEHDAGCSGAGFVEDVADVGFGFAEPHGQEFGAFDADEIGLAFVGDCAREEGFSTALMLNFI